MNSLRSEVYWLERKQIAISNKSGNSFTGPSGGLNVRMLCTLKGKTFVSGDTGTSTETGMTEEPNIPSEFHDALVSGVLSRLYTTSKENLQVADYWRGAYQDVITKAKKSGDTTKDGSTPYVRGYDF